jgi:predicted transcriptional regulator
VSSEPHITEAESVVMGPLWRLGPLTPARLMTEVKDVQPWADTTIKTLLGRLIQKQAVRSEKHEGVVRYRPLIERTDYVRSEVRHLLDRLFEGRREGLIAFLQADPPP